MLQMWPPNRCSNGVATPRTRPSRAALRLDDHAEARGYRLITATTIASTNDAGLARAGNGDPGRLWLLADEQTAGRGRRGRRWASPPGNLYATLLLIDPASIGRVAELGFVAAIAAARAVQALGVTRDRLAIKWPNDLVSGGAKFAGLLLETRQLPDRQATVIGFGMNCAWRPMDLAYVTTDLSRIVGRPVAPPAIFAPLSKQMVDMLDLWDRGAGFPQVREIWLDFAAGLGHAIRVDTGARRHEGIFETIDQHGRLLLRTDNGTLAIEAGDVFVD